MKKEYFVSLFNPKANIALIINKIMFKIKTKNTEETSKFGVQGPDLYSPDKLKNIIDVIEIT